MSDFQPDLSMTFARFCAAQPEEMQAVLAEHSRRYKTAISALFEACNSDGTYRTMWAVFAGDSDKPVLSGADLMDYPDDEALMALGKQKDCPILPYVHPRCGHIEPVTRDYS